jgi:hypothetical protein
MFISAENNMSMRLQRKLHGRTLKVALVSVPAKPILI